MYVAVTYTLQCRNLLYPPVTGGNSFHKTQGQKSGTWTVDPLSAMTAMHGTFLEHNNYLHFRTYQTYTTETCSFCCFVCNPIIH